MRIVERRRTFEQTRLWDTPRRLSTNVPLNNWVLAKETGAPCKDSQLADPDERISNDRVREMFGNSFAKRIRKTLTPVVLETPREFLLTFPAKALQVQPVEGSTPKLMSKMCCDDLGLPGSDVKNFPVIAPKRGSNMVPFGSPS
ncbi:hypothetical protein HZH66_009087 [Vespula vulgaris]|uniref:Uncharacterized protein n=1 Tax=Vespula vulgaris TaxID=7454 RepID=A0A834JUK6_VESVU|nr:hypothetical protein HZH66_009087 [Vespula vulgaris]